MKTIKIANKECIFIEVADDCKPEQIAHNIINKPNSLIFEYSVKIITTTNSITEEIAKSVVEYKYLKNKPFITGREYWYKSYTYVRKGWEFSFHTALESFYSLMKSLELDRKSKNYLLIEKI